MVDFIKFSIENTGSLNLEENILLEFKGTFSVRSGEVFKRKVANYRGMKFIVYEKGYIIIQGSLHKYLNNGKHNYNDFSFDSLQEVLNDLRIRFGLDLNNCILRNIEFGVNICPTVAVSQIINNLLIHKNEKFKDVSLRAGNYRQAMHSQYLVKVYDKGLQYSLDSPLVRVEVKYFKMQKLNVIGIRKLSDLTTTNWIKPIEAILKNEWAACILFDTTIRETGLKREIKDKKLHHWSNAEYWLGLTKQERCRQLKSYLFIVDSNSENLKTSINSLIVEKWRALAANAYHFTL